MAKVRHLMTPSPHSIGVEQSLAEADRRMRAHHIRHLPALKGGKLEGLISDRDVAIVSSLPGFDPEKITVEEAMSPAPYSVTPDTEIADVVKEMASFKYGSAVVVDRDKVVGIVTTVDCLGLLWDHLMREGAPAQNMRPAAVRQRIRGEHHNIRAVLDEISEAAKSVEAGDVDAAPGLRVQARSLFERLGAHLDLEDRILAPALRETAGFGKEREALLLEHHTSQRNEINEALAALEDLSPADLARRILAFVDDVRTDMDGEDKDLLHPNLLKDDLIDVELGG